MRLPTSILVSVSLFTAETTAALYLSTTYRSDHFWQALTLLFTLVPSVLVQLTLTFIHRELSQDRPLVLLLHILQLGPIVRSADCLLVSFVVVVVVTLLDMWMSSFVLLLINTSYLNTSTSNNLFTGGDGCAAHMLLASRPFVSTAVPL